MNTTHNVTLNSIEYETLCECRDELSAIYAIAFDPELDEITRYNRLMEEIYK
jgi:hypothetical protein